MDGMTYTDHTSYNEPTDHASCDVTTTDHTSYDVTNVLSSLCLLIINNRITINSTSNGILYSDHKSSALVHCNIDEVYHYDHFLLHFLSLSPSLYN